MDREKMAKWVAELEALKSERDEDSGICGNCLSLPFLVLLPLFEKWPKYSGIPEYPVPSPDKKTTAKDAYYRYSLWDTDSQYGKDRWELVEFLIKELRKELEVT